MTQFEKDLLEIKAARDKRIAEESARIISNKLRQAEDIEKYKKVVKEVVSPAFSILIELFESTLNFQGFLIADMDEEEDGNGYINPTGVKFEVGGDSPMYIIADNSDNKCVLNFRLSINRNTYTDKIHFDYENITVDDIQRFAVDNYKKTQPQK